MKNKERTKDQVRNILRDIEATRNCDAYLLVCYVHKYIHSGYKLIDGESYISASALKKIGDLTRARRQVQNTDGEYLPTDPAVRKQRRIKYNEDTEYYATSN